MPCVYGGMEWQKSPAALIDTFHQALPDDPRVERKKMFGYPSAFVGGHMVCGLFRDSVIVRLPEPERATLLALDGAHTFEPMAGRPMKEYIVAPQSVVDDPASLRDWLSRSVAYGATLVPKSEKATKAPKASAAPKTGRR